MSKTDEASIRLWRVCPSGGRTLSGEMMGKVVEAPKPLLRRCRTNMRSGFQLVRAKSTRFPVLCFARVVGKNSSTWQYLQKSYQFLLSSSAKIQNTLAARGLEES
jgi:ubiquinone/menaquinone biosynthesis C-methylase UbiE